MHVLSYRTQPNDVLGAQATQVQLALVRPWRLREPVHSQAPPLLRAARDM